MSRPPDPPPAKPFRAPRSTLSVAARNGRAIVGVVYGGEVTAAVATDAAGLAAFGAECLEIAARMRGYPAPRLCKQCRRPNDRPRPKRGFAAVYCSTCQRERLRENWRRSNRKRRGVTA